MSEVLGRKGYFRGRGRGKMERCAWDEDEGGWAPKESNRRQRVEKRLLLFSEEHSLSPPLANLT